MFLQPRTTNFLAFLAIFGIFIFTLFVQFGLKLQPCPLCVFQRFALIAAGLVFFIAFLHNPKKIGLKIYAVLSLLFLIIGAFLSARHIWLQNAPLDKLPSCGGASLEYMLEVLPLTQIMQEVFNGSGDCMKKDAVFFSISMPVWAFAGFVLLSFAALKNLFYSTKISTNDIKLNLK